MTATSAAWVQKQSCTDTNVRPFLQQVGTPVRGAVPPSPLQAQLLPTGPGDSGSSKARPPVPPSPPPRCAQKLSPSACWESTRLRENLLASMSPVPAPNCCLGGPHLHAGTTGRCSTRGLHTGGRWEYRAHLRTMAQSSQRPISSPSQQSRPHTCPITPGSRPQGTRDSCGGCCAPMNVRTAPLSPQTLTVHADTHLGGWTDGWATGTPRG